MTRLLYNDNNIIGRLFKYFSVYFENLYVSTAETVFLLVLSMLAVESASSVRSLYNHFLVGITAKSLNAFYYAFTYSKLDTRQFMNITGRMALKLIPSDLREQPVFICIDDTMVPKAGKTFDNVAVLFDHASHNDSNYLNDIVLSALCFVYPFGMVTKSSIYQSYLAIECGRKTRLLK